MARNSVARAIQRLTPAAFGAPQTARISVRFAHCSHSQRAQSPGAQAILPHFTGLGPCLRACEPPPVPALDGLSRGLTPVGIARTTSPGDVLGARARRWARKPSAKARSDHDRSRDSASSGKKFRPRMSRSRPSAATQCRLVRRPMIGRRILRTRLETGRSRQAMAHTRRAEPRAVVRFLTSVPPNLTQPPPVTAGSQREYFSDPGVISNLLPRSPHHGDRAWPGAGVCSDGLVVSASGVKTARRRTQRRRSMWPKPNTAKSCHGTIGRPRPAACNLAVRSAEPRPNQQNGKSSPSPASARRARRRPMAATGASCASPHRTGVGPTSAGAPPACHRSQHCGRSTFDRVRNGSIGAAGNKTKLKKK